MPGSKKDLQVADWVFRPLALGWHLKKWHPSVSYNFWAPTGRFNAGAPNNTGKGLFSDLQEGKMTLPMIIGRERDPQLSPLLEEVLEELEQGGDVSELSDRVVASLERTGAVEDCREKNDPLYERSDLQKTNS